MNVFRFFKIIFLLRIRDNQMVQPEYKAQSKTLDSPVTSPADTKEYRAIQLLNGLKAILISDTKGYNEDGT